VANFRLPNVGWAAGCWPTLPRAHNQAGLGALTKKEPKPPEKEAPKPNGQMPWEKGGKEGKSPFSCWPILEENHARGGGGQNGGGANWLTNGGRRRLPLIIEDWLPHFLLIVLEEWKRGQLPAAGGRMIDKAWGTQLLDGMGQGKVAASSRELNLKNAIFEFFFLSKYYCSSPGERNCGPKHWGVGRICGWRLGDGFSHLALLTAIKWEPSRQQRRRRTGNGRRQQP
jgi:hypothetical protein